MVTYKIVLLIKMYTWRTFSKFNKLFPFASSNVHWNCMSNFMSNLNVLTTHMQLYSMNHYQWEKRKEKKLPNTSLKKENWQTVT